MSFWGYLSACKWVSHRHGSAGAHPEQENHLPFSASRRRRDLLLRTYTPQQEKKQNGKNTPTDMKTRKSDHMFFFLLLFLLLLLLPRHVCFNNGSCEREGTERARRDGTASGLLGYGLPVYTVVWTTRRNQLTTLNDNYHAPNLIKNVSKKTGTTTRE